VSDTESKIEFFQYPESFLAKPGFIPELKSVPKPFRSWESRKEDAELLKSLFLKFESGRELPEGYSQLLFQRRSMVKKKGKRFPTVLQPFDVCDEPASLDGKREFLGGPFIPTSKDLFLRQAIKRDIQLDGVEMLSIEFEPFSLGEIRGIKDPIPPMGVIVTAGTDENHISDCACLPAGREFGIPN